ncbi:MAG: tyrosine-type recombinase/integrase [Sulfurimonas sp.]
MARFTSSGKFTGVKYETLDNSDRSYYIVYKIAGTSKTVHIGKRSEGITEEFCHQKRNEAINRAKFGDDAPVIKYKKKSIATLDELASLYFEDKALHNRNNEKRRKDYNKHFSPIFGENDITDISSEMIEKWQRDKSKEICKATKRLYASKTINNLINDLSAIINYAIAKGKFKGENPVKSIKRQKVQNERQRYLSIDETKLLLQEIRKHKDGELLELFVILSLSTGGRIKTICNIKVQDIDFVNGIISLLDFKNSTAYKGFLSKEAMSYCQKWATKNNFKRNDFIVSYDGKRLFQEDTTNDEVKLISNRLKPIINRLFNQGIDASNAIDRAVIHTLRHTYASQLAIAGTPIFTIQKLMNHKDISQTLRYAKLAPDTGKDAVLTMSNALLGFV